MRISDWSSDVCSSDLRPFEFLWVKIYSLCKIGQLVWRMLRPNYTKDLDLFRACSSYFRSEEHTSELQSLMRISYAVFCLTKKMEKIRERNNHRLNQIH